MEEDNPVMPPLSVEILEFSALVEEGRPIEVLKAFLARTRFPESVYYLWSLENPELARLYTL